MCLVIDDTLIWDNRIDQKMSKYRNKNHQTAELPLHINIHYKYMTIMQSKTVQYVDI